jgi:hypothetical protein
MLIGLGENGVLRPEGERVREELAGRGFEVEVEVRGKVDPFWYVENAAPEDQVETVETAEKVAGWLAAMSRESPVSRSLEDV